MKTKQEQMSLRLTSEAKRLLTALALKLGLSQAGVIELAIRRMAEKESIE